MGGLIKAFLFFTLKYIFLIGTYIQEKTGETVWRIKGSVGRNRLDFFKTNFPMALCKIYPLEKEDSEVQKQNYNLTQETAEIRKRIKYLSEYLSK